jgi:hypothetical protein
MKAHKVQGIRVKKRVTGAEQGWGDEPSVLIFADREQDRAAAQEAAESVGARVIGSEPLSGALERLSRQVAVDAVFIEVAGSTVEGDRLIEWANHAAREQTAAPIISFPHALIDFVHARVEAPSVQMICGESIVERVSAFGTALAERKHRLHDQGVEADAERLRRLSEEVARIAGALAELSSSARTAPLVSPSLPRAPESGIGIDADTVRALIRVRRLRDQFFSKDLFADPAWDMLLDLMAARLEKSRVAVSSLCIAAAVPATTALRWIRTLTEHGLFVRRHDPEDGRRIFIELSDGASDALTAYFRTIQQMGVRIG